MVGFERSKDVGCARANDDEEDAEEDDDLSAHVLEAFEHYERHLCSDIVKAASIVDVGTWARGNLEDVNECKEKLSDYITKFADQYEEPDGFVEKAEEQMLSYLNNEGVYATEAVLGLSLIHI